jgi:hypothetical protein
MIACTCSSVYLPPFKLGPYSYGYAFNVQAHATNLLMDNAAGEGFFVFSANM